MRRRRCMRWAYPATGTRRGACRGHAPRPSRHPRWRGRPRRHHRLVDGRARRRAAASPYRHVGCARRAGHRAGSTFTVARRRFPAIADLHRGAQLADHVVFGALVGVVLARAATRRTLTWRPALLGHADREDIDPEQGIDDRHCRARRAGRARCRGRHRRRARARRPRGGGAQTRGDPPVRSRRASVARQWRDHHSVEVVEDLAQHREVVPVGEQRLTYVTAGDHHVLEAGAPHAAQPGRRRGSDRWPTPHGTGGPAAS